MKAKFKMCKKIWKYENKQNLNQYKKNNKKQKKKNAKLNVLSEIDIAS